MNDINHPTASRGSYVPSRRPLQATDEGAPQPPRHQAPPFTGDSVNLSGSDSLYRPQLQYAAKSYGAYPGDNHGDYGPNPETMHAASTPPLHPSQPQNEDSYHTPPQYPQPPNWTQPVVDNRYGPHPETILAAPTNEAVGPKNVLHDDERKIKLKRGKALATQRARDKAARLDKELRAIFTKGIDLQAENPGLKRAAMPQTSSGQMRVAEAGSSTGVDYTDFQSGLATLNSSRVKGRRINHLNNLISKYTEALQQLEMEVIRLKNTPVAAEQHAREAEEQRARTHSTWY